MSDEIEQDGIGHGTSRRDFIKKSALATGAVWAAPAILNVGPAAFGASGTGDCPPEGLAIFKYNLAQDDDVASFEVTDKLIEPGKKHPYNTGCGFPGSEADVNTAIGNGKVVVSGGGSMASIDGMAIGVVETLGANGKYQVTFTIPAKCELRSVQAKAGSPNQNDPSNCDTVLSPDYDNNMFTVGLPAKDVSNVSVLLCCTPAPA